MLSDFHCVPLIARLMRFSCTSPAVWRICQSYLSVKPLLNSPGFQQTLFLLGALSYSTVYTYCKYDISITV